MVYTSKIAIVFANTFSFKRFNFTNTYKVFNQKCAVWAPCVNFAESVIWHYTYNLSHLFLHSSRISNELAGKSNLESIIYTLPNWGRSVAICINWIWSVKEILQWVPAFRIGWSFRKIVKA